VAVRCEQWNKRQRQNWNLSTEGVREIPENVTNKIVCDQSWLIGKFVLIILWIKKIIESFMNHVLCESNCRTQQGKTIKMTDCLKCLIWFDVSVWQNCWHFVLQQGNSTWVAMLRISSVTAWDVERSYVLNVRNDVGEQQYRVRISSSSQPEGT
jgi:hypothetical protein